MRMELGEERAALPEGKVLTAEIASIKEVEKTWVDQKTGENAIRIAWEFVILDEEFAGRRHWEDLFKSFYPGDRCRMYQWVLKILNRETLPEDFVLDTDAFVGTKVPVMFELRHYTIKNGPNAGKPGSSLEVNILSETEAQGLRASGGAAGTSQVASEGIQKLEEPFPDAPAKEADPLEEPF